MIDPWRNPPWGGWDWYLSNFPFCEVDLGLSTHAHFDHDNLHSLHSSVLLDRLIGRFEFADVVVNDFADKHVFDSTHNKYDWAGLNQKLTPMETKPPKEIWDAIGTIDIALLPIDGSEHILSYQQIDAVRSRLRPYITIPHHYFVWNITHRASCLLPRDAWMENQRNSRFTEKGEITFRVDEVKDEKDLALCFGNDVAFIPKEEFKNKDIKVGA